MRDIDLSDLLGPSAAPADDRAVLPPAEEGRASPPAGGMAIVGAPYEGADRTTSRMMTWNPIIAPVNAEVIPSKPTMDARGRDMARNDGGIAGSITLAKDHIAGQQYLLNAKPESRILFGKEDETWETECQEEVELKFTLWAESTSCWPDASRHNTLTGLVRLGVGGFCLGGEVLASAEWGADDGRPFQSSILMLDPDRLCDPRHNAFAPNVNGGVEVDRRGAPIAYHILDRHPGDWKSRRLGERHQWRRIMARKPHWGRPNILHIFEQTRPDQSRGISALVTALTEMKMLKEFRKVDLQRAVVAATYAATIESDLPGGDIYTAMGAGEGNAALQFAQDYMACASAYSEAAKALQMDGVKIPTLLPGSKLNIRAPGASSPLGADFETSMQRHLAAALGISYEEFSRDFSKTNYSSGRAAMGLTERRMAALKKMVADGIASFIYRLWFEEAINAGALECMKRRDAPSFYEGLNADAYCAAEWIGSGRGQVDEMKESQAAMLRIRGGLTTLEQEVSRLGGDYRKVVKQRAREHELIKKTGLPSPYDTEPTDAENAAQGTPREPAE